MWQQERDLSWSPFNTSVRFQALSETVLKPTSPFYSGENEAQELAEVLDQVQLQNRNEAFWVTVVPNKQHTE